MMHEICTSKSKNFRFVCSTKCWTYLSNEKIRVSFPLNLNKKTREIFSFVNVNWHHSTAKWNLKFHVCTIMLMCDPYTLKARAISMPNANLMCYVIKGLHLEDQQDFIFVPQVDVIHFLGCFNLKQDSSLWRERRDKLKWKHWIETKLKDS